MCGSRGATGHSGEVWHTGTSCSSTPGLERGRTHGRFWKGPAWCLLQCFCLEGGGPAAGVGESEWRLRPIGQVVRTGFWFGLPGSCGKLFCRPSASKLCGGLAGALRGVRGPWGGHGPRAVGALVRKPGHWRLRRLQRRRSCRPARRVRWHRVLRLRFCFRTGTHGRSVLPALGRAVRRSQSSKASVSLRPPSRPPGHAGPGPSASLRLVGV